MSLVFDGSSIAASGTLVTVLSTDANDLGPCRLTIKNSGANALTAAQVLTGPDSSRLGVLDSVTFASLASGAVAGLWIAAPVKIVVVKVTCASGTTLSIALSNAVGIN
jgi:hypothetical protein